MPNSEELAEIRITDKLVKLDFLRRQIPFLDKRYITAPDRLETLSETLLDIVKSSMNEARESFGLSAWGNIHNVNLPGYVIYSHYRNEINRDYKIWRQNRTNPWVLLFFHLPYKTDPLKFLEEATGLPLCEDCRQVYDDAE